MLNSVKTRCSVGYFHIPSIVMFIFDQNFTAVVVAEGDQSPYRSTPYTPDADPSSIPKVSFMESMRVGSSRRSVDYSGGFDQCLIIAIICHMPSV